MRPRTLLALAAAAAIAACNSDALNPIATSENDTATVTLGALRSTPLTVPSGYSISLSEVVRTDQIVPPFTFDFLYDIDSVQGPAFYPIEVVGLVPHSATNPGFKRTTVPFDSLTLADLNGYTTDSLMPAHVGDIFMIRSQISCSQGVPLYGKLAVQSIDSVAHTITFRILVDDNCGFRSLKLGLPKA